MVDESTYKILAKKASVANKMLFVAAENSAADK